MPVRLQWRGVRFTGTRWEPYTNIRYEQRLCHEYRAGLGAACLIMGGKVGMRDLEKAVSC